MIRPATTRPRRALVAILAVAVAALPAGPWPLAQGLPDLGDSAQKLMTPAQERRLGETAVKQMRAAGGYLEDPEVNDYLNELGRKLVSARPDTRFDFEFFAVPDPSINAFAIPGGFIGVNTGLILLAQTESELASVLAHEISHITQNHMARLIAGQQNALLLSLAALAVALVAARSNSSSANDLVGAAITSAQALAIQNQLNFTREHEYEADRIGFLRLQAAGFDAAAAATLMERLQKASRFTDGSVPSYLRTHPVTYERIAEAQSRARDRPYRQVADSLDFQMVRALLRSYVGRSHEAVSWFDGAIAERRMPGCVVSVGRHDEVLFTHAYGSRSLVPARTPMTSDTVPPHPMIEAIAGHVLLESGDATGAVARFEAALARYPNKMQLVYDYPDALLKAGRAADAAQFAERELQRFPTDGLLHRVAAKAYAAQNRRLKHHMHQGEYYAWQGNLRGAIDQFELASKAGDGDYYEASYVEARARELKREMQVARQNERRALFE
jgi:predicted Zn-dependent protease